MQTFEEGVQEVAYGTAAGVFAGQAAWGYVVIAILAFALGVLFTIFCFRIRKHREEEEHDRKS